MNCHSVRKYFYAFLDGELDVEKNIEVLAHLDMCCECGMKIERERLIQKRVKETVCKTTAPAHIERRIFSNLKTAERRSGIFSLFKFKKSWMPVSRLIPLAAGIAAMIFLSVYLLVRHNGQAGSGVLLAAESKYHNYVMKHTTPDIRSQDAGEIAEYLQGQTGLNVTLPGLKEDVQLVGASYSEINGTKVSQVFCKHDGVPIVLFVACNSDVDFSEMKEVLTGGMVVYTATGACGSCRIIGWKEAGSRYVMVSGLDNEKMINVLTNV